MIPRGRPVTIVCRGPAGFKTFRLENEEDTNDFKDTRASSPLGPHQTEARFLIPAVSEGTATHYRCRYIKEHVWSEPSESLELVVTGEVLSAALRFAPGPWTLSPAMSSVCRLPRPSVGPSNPLLPSPLCTHVPLPSHLAQVPGPWSQLDTAPAPGWAQSWPCWAGGEWASRDVVGQSPLKEPVSCPSGCVKSSFPLGQNLWGPKQCGVVHAHWQVTQSRGPQAGLDSTLWEYLG